MASSDFISNADALRNLESRPTSPGADEREREQENSLRPTSFNEFVGQARIIENLRVAISAARAREEALDHILFSGPPGLGKTTLSRILAQEMGTGLHSTSGPALDRARDLVGILTQLKPGDILFIDEVHRIPVAVEEFLYTAMEDFTIDFTLDQGPNARILPLTIAPFTLVGATTREGLLSAPLRGRYGILERLTPYSQDDLQCVLTRSASILDLQLAPQAAALIAGRSRGTPRIANRYLRRARDLAQVRGSKAIAAELAEEALERMGVDALGLEDMDRRILLCLGRRPGIAVGLKTIAAAVGESEDTVEEVFEPHLLRRGLIERTARGRCITPAGCRAVQIPMAESGANSDLF